MTWLEITTKIGCSNMCSYCPQTKLIEQYNHQKKVLTLDDYLLILSHVNPIKTQIHFSGFSEPFLTPNIEDMMIETFKRGYCIVLYTTLVGFTEKKCKKLSDSGISFDWVDFHEYDNVDLNKFNAQKELFIKNIQSKYYNTTKITNPNSRAGNNWSVDSKVGKIKCMTNRFFNNVVLPNGDVFLCCNDWSLKHKIGNLFENNYDSPEFIKKRIEIITECNKNNGDVLCRTCEQSFI